MTAKAGKLLNQHYVDNFRSLPWRSPPGIAPPDPYRVWLSEIMLQQTTVAAVIPRFERFVARWPTVAALAAATDDDVLSEWAGLGYYARARNLIACARVIATKGRFPPTANELKKLPGIGAYTSAAIAAIAFGEKAPAIDTNVERVIARLNGMSQPKRRGVEAALLAMMSNQCPGDIIQALMDLGAGICRPRQPRCSACPLRGECVALARGSPEDYPERRAKTRRPHRYGTASWIERDGKVWMVRRPAKGLLGGMAALPGSEWTDAPRIGGGLGTVRHVFTHFTLDLTVVRGVEPDGIGWWQPIAELDCAGLPTLYRKAAELALRGTLSIAA